MVLKQTAVILVAAPFRYRSDIADATIFSRVVDLAHADLLDAVERRKELAQGSAIPRTHGADAVDADEEHAPACAAQKFLPVFAHSPAGWVRKLRKGVGRSRCSETRQN